ncbi:MAG: hypothetical protein K2G55_05860 [Lachnospiraceae bacterium]|nr:hypothetical protein [Lachnospiraceae bacterium]
MIEVFADKGKFYNDWIENPLPVILFGIGEEGKIWLNKLILLDIQIDAVIDSYFKGNYKQYEVKESISNDSRFKSTGNYGKCLY